MPAQQLPPPGKPIKEQRTPNHADGFFRELVSRESSRYQALNPIKRGTLYSSTVGSDDKVSRAFPELYFCIETVPIGSNTVAGMTQSEFVIWNWSSDIDAESSFNAEISYLGDAIANPVYARIYTIRRDEYEASPALPVGVGTPLTSLLGVKMTAIGRDYTQAYGTFVGPDDKTAQIEFVISNGQLISAIVINEGGGFTAASTVDIIGDGTGAAATLIIQPAAAVLTSQKKVELGDGDPLAPEFVKVLRVWEVLPGPWIPFTRYDDDLGPVQGRRRAVLNTGQLGGVITGSGKTNYEGRDGSSVVSIEIQEGWTTGAGTIDNPYFPILFWSTDDPQDQRGIVAHTSQIKASLGPGDVASITHVGNKATRRWYEPYADNPNLMKALTESWLEPVISDAELTHEFGGGLLAVTETTAEPGTQPIDAGLFVVESRIDTKNPNRQTKRNKFLFGGAGGIWGAQDQWPPIPGAHTDEKTGIVLNFTKQFIDATLAVPARSGYRGPFVEDQPYDRFGKFRITTAPDLATLPPSETWYTSRPFNLPDRLISIEAVWRDTVSKSAAVSRGMINNMTATIHSGCGGDIIVTSQSGFRGHARTKVVRDFFYGPIPPFPVTPYIIKPSSGTVILFSSDFSSHNSGTDAETPSIQGLDQYQAFTNGGGLGDDFRQQVSPIHIQDHLVGPDLQILSSSASSGINNVSGNVATHQPQAVSAFANSPAGKVRAVIFFGTAAATFGRMEVRIPYSNPTPTYLSGLGEILYEVELQEWGYGIWVSYRYYIQLAGLV